MRENRIDDVVRESMRHRHKLDEPGYAGEWRTMLYRQSHNDSVQKVRLSRERRKQRRQRN